MEKSKITKFYTYQKKSSSSRNKVSLKKPEIVQCTLDKSVESISPVSKNTRSSTRSKSKSITRQSSKINDFFKSHEEPHSLNVTFSIPNHEKEDNNNNPPSFASTTLEKTADNFSQFPDEGKISFSGFVTPTKSFSKLSSPHKRRYIETISLSTNEKSSTPESTTKDEADKNTIAQDKNNSSLETNRSVRKKLSLGDKNEKELVEDVEKQNEGDALDAQNITTSEFWDLSFSPLSKISRPLSPLPETPKKLREMRQAAAVRPGSSSKKCVVNLNKILDVPDSPGKCQIDLNMTKTTLAKCGKLEELKKHLLKMKELKEEHNQRTKIGKSPVMSPVKTTKDEATNESLSTNKADKAPAYERFKHLVLPSVPSLTLPHSYTILEDFFKSTDTVVSMMFNRSEVCTLSKVQAAVQEMTKRNFENTVLGQIKTVYPGAYEFKQEKGLPRAGYKCHGYQLTLTPLFDAVNSKDFSEEKIKFTSSDILRRQKIFHSNLINLVKKKHKVFLQSLNLSIPEEKLTRWHPRFRLDKVPEVEPCALPEPPHMKVYQSAKDVLEDTKKRLHPKVKTALENVAAASNLKTPMAVTVPVSNSSKADLKGIPQGLLERIRAKEAQRLEESITRSPTKDRKNKMLDRLPEISRILRNYFVTEKKPALLFDHLLEKISESYKTPISKADAENHLKLLLEVAPNWITVANTMKGKYIKLDKSIKLQNIHEKIIQYQKSI